MGHVMSDRIHPVRPSALLLDTNVWVNSQLGASSGHENARKLVTTALDQGIRLGIAPHSLASVFYIIHRYLKRIAASEGKALDAGTAAAAKEAAWGVVNNIMEYAEVVGSDYSDAHIASLYRKVHDDFEDNLVIAAARRMQADLLVTDDIALVKHAPVPVMTTEDALRWVDGAAK